MPGNEGTLAVVTKELVQAFTLLQEVMQPDAFADLLRDLGIDDPPNLTTDTTFSGKLSTVVDAAAELLAEMNASNGRLVASIAFANQPEGAV